MNPQRGNSPTSMSPYMLACLEAVRDSGFGQAISLGGALGLFHYIEHRETSDIDAWWTSEATAAERQAVIAAVKAALSTYGSVEERRFGDVVSIELHIENKVRFSFQVAQRSALLREPVSSEWAPVRIDSFDDLIASKMTALVDRGAPRDFIDIFECCQHGLCDVNFCWSLWQEREIKRGVVPDMAVACEAVRLHLSRIERQRPLPSIPSEESREKASRLREWFKHEFCTR